MSQLRILEVIRQGQIGGGETHMLDLVSNLKKTEFQPIVLSFTSGPMLDNLDKVGIEWHLIETQKPFDSNVTNAVTDLLKELNIDIVHAHGTRAMSNIYKSAKKLNLPTIYTIHGWSFHKGLSPISQMVRILSEQFLTSQATYNISVSKSNQLTGQKKLFFFKSTVINNAINLQKFNPYNEYKDIRSELGIDKSKFLFGFIARMTYQKDPLIMIKAFKLFFESNKNAHLLMVGNGELDDQVTDLIETEELTNHVTLLPFRQDVPDLLHAIDVYCLPSLWEGMPIGLLEAMAMKKSVIATDVDGTKELLKNNKNGLLVKPNNSSKLAVAMCDLYNNQKTKENIAQNAYITIQENFNISGMVDKVEKLYKQCQ